MPRHFTRREDRMKSLISPVQRRPPVLPGPSPRDDDATSTAPVSGRTVATTDSRVVREARNYADPDILAPRWLRVYAHCGPRGGIALCVVNVDAYRAARPISRRQNHATQKSGLASTMRPPAPGRSSP